MRQFGNNLPDSDQLDEDNSTHPFQIDGDELPIDGMDQQSIIKAVRKLMARRRTGLLKDDT
jgi:hypothetical protein